MEPVTHMLTGACLARTGLNRRAAYTTLAMAVAAEFPDIDTLWSLRGPVSGFEHHRGITHTFVGLPFEAALLVAAVYGLHRWRQARRPVSAKDPLTQAPVRWGLLYFFTLIALLSHLLLDYTNNYGLRPFFPFNPRWYAASITFIFDPLMFAMLLAALILPALFRLIGSEVTSGARRPPFAARGWAMAALLGVVALWTLRETQHNSALELAISQSAQSQTAEAQTADTQTADAPAADAPVYLAAQRALASPDPLNPFRWWMVTDFGPFYQLSQADTLHASLVPAQAMQPKLNPTAASIAAESSPVGRVYLDWSSMPFLDISTADGAALDAFGEPLTTGHTLVTFRDPRFMGDVPLLHSAGRSALTATVELDAAQHVVRQTMGSRAESEVKSER